MLENNLNENEINFFLNKIFKMFLFEVDKKTLENFSYKYENVRNKFENMLENEEKRDLKIWLIQKELMLYVKIIQKSFKIYYFLLFWIEII